MKMTILLYNSLYLFSKAKKNGDFFVRNNNKMQ